MGLFDKIFKPKKTDPEKAVAEYFEMLTGYRPIFTSFEGSVYEMDLTRSVIHSFATHCSKLNMEVKGSANERLAKILKTNANIYTDTSKYLYRLATIREVTNNAFIIPSFDLLTDKVEGFFPVYPEQVELVEYNNVLYVRFTFNNKKVAIEYNKIGVLNQFQFKDDFFGEDNKTMLPTMQLIDTQEQGIIEGIKSSATIRFMGQLTSVLKNEDIKKERERFAEINLSSNNQTGVMIFDQKYKEVKQIVSTPFTIDASQMQNIKESVYTHFGTNDEILQNKFNSEQWSAYYEGKIEPFAIQSSLVHTNMTFTEKEKSFGNMILFTANRLQYLSNNEKLQTVTQLFDRGFLTHNQGLEIFNMPFVENGDKRFIRKEYAETNNLDAEITKQKIVED
ncbi:phage portal protein [Parvimonas micra]|uniref:phage portal protein n=1 Tax=Parvimonas micra TaxID=33033 RepID=UPI002B4AA825|nr:phage portal protein [Parvimonas micra]MEB3029102.1 phage portal protein [Parvimonas micra]